MSGLPAEARPLLCTRCGAQVDVVEDARSLIDWGPAVIDADGVVRPQFPDPNDQQQTITYDVDITRTRAVCTQDGCRHQWALRRKFDPTTPPAARVVAGQDGAP